MTQNSPDPTESNAAAEPQLEPQPAFGWTSYAELINGRFAMIGFVALLILELVTGESFWSWLGL
ncbi:MAG: hypothetical protein KME07_17000 [Pegethrix bostrychoides GSE-TBD4-15B]|jgi:hypothetical protein|uniref:High light inducible protein n=1 Tax=Pegethrix bostrychoides GSE-TBD4-15B TaxID=2839662 RepID=A0A951PDE9_9CYAN|nr:hypothetical protein [Pegethrix bostrychoides GSE-TBD4-15B]